MTKAPTLTNSLARILRYLSLFILSFIFAIAQHLWFPPQSSLAAPSAQIAILNTFVSNTVDPGVSTTYRITLRNSTGAPITITSLNKTLTNVPGPITIASTTPSLNTCTGSGIVTLNSGTEPTPGGSAGASGSFSISGYTIPVGAPGQCVIEFPVRGFSAGNHTDTIPSSALVTSAGENLDATSATLQINSFASATLSKSFTPNTIPGDGRSLVTITINNPNTFVLTGTTTVPTLVDTLPSTPSQLVVDTRSGAPAPSTTCTGGTPSIVTGSSNTQVQLLGGTIPASSNCTITFPVTSSVSGTYTNDIPINTLNTQNRISNSNSPSANLAVQNEVTITKSGLGNNIPEGSGNVRTITINVSNGGAQITGLSVTDPLPSLLEVAPTPNARSSCNATNTLIPWTTQPAAGASSFTLNSTTLGQTAIVLASNPITNTLGTCQILVDVRVNIGAVGNLGDPTNAIAGTNTINRTTDFGNQQSRVPPADATNNFTVIAGLTVTKTYSPNLIAPGSTTRVTINIQNRSGALVTGVGFTDTLPTSNPGAVQLLVENPASTTTPPTTSNCGTTPTLIISAVNKASSVGLTGASIASGRTCTFSFDVFAPSNTPIGSNFDNTINNNTITNNQGLDSNGVTGTEGRLSVNSRVTVGKSFSQSSVSRGLPSTVTITITNNRRSANGTAEPLNNVGITDNLPPNLQVANLPNSNNTCNGAISGATFGSTSIVLSGGSIPPSSSCTIKFDVIEIDRTITPLPQTYDNTPSNFVNAAVSLGDGTFEPATLPTARLTVISPLSGVKSFQSPAVTANGVSRATIEFRNTDLNPLTNLSFTDSWAQANTQIATIPDFKTTCGTGGSFTYNAATNRRLFSFAGGTIPAQVGGVAGICTVSFDVTITTGTPNTFINTIQANTVSTTQGFTNPSDISGTLTRVTNNLTVIKSFTPQALTSVGDPSVLKVDITNPGTSGLVATNVNFIDTMDTTTSQILVFPVPSATTTNCGSSPAPTILLPGSPRPSGFAGAATLGVNEFGITGGTINAGATCSISIRTTRNTTGNRTNTIPANTLALPTISTREGTTNTSATSATLNALPALDITKAFAPTTVATGEVSRLTVTIQNRQASGELGGPLTNVRFTDNLPANLKVAPDPKATTTCTSNSPSPGTSGVFNPVLVGGETSITLQSFDLPFNTSCTAQIDVVASVANTYTNSILPANVQANLQTSIGGGTTTSNGTATSILTVTSAPTISKSFSPSSINQGAISTLTIQLGNAAGAAITLTSPLVDTLPTNLKVAPTPNIGGTCTTANIVAIAGGSSITYNNGSTIPNGGCTISVQVTSSINGTYTNTIAAAALKTSGGNNVNQTSADLVVSGSPKINLVKRITNINGTDITGFDLRATATADSNDRDANWPSANTQYLRGAIACPTTGVCPSPKPSDSVEYTIYFLSNGTAPAKNVQFCDRVPDNTTFKTNTYGSGSGILLGWDSTGAVLPDPTNSTLGSGKAAITNIPDADLGQFLAANVSLTGAPSPCDNGGANPNGAVLVQLGVTTTVPPATAPATPKNSYGFVRFVVNVN